MVFLARLTERSDVRLRLGMCGWMGPRGCGLADFSSVRWVPKRESVRSGNRRGGEREMKDALNGWRQQGEVSLLRKFRFGMVDSFRGVLT